MLLSNRASRGRCCQHCAPSALSARPKACDTSVNVARRQHCPSRYVGLGSRAEVCAALIQRSEEHTSELQSLMRISYDVFCLKTKNKTITKRDLTLRTTTH